MRAQNVKESGFEFCNFPFRRCKRPFGADAVETGGVLLSVIYSYAARARRNELRSNHRRKRDALPVKSAAVLCCAPKQIPAFFSHKRAITFERLYTGTKAILLSSRAHFDDIVAYLPGPVRCDKGALSHLLPACREDVDACCLLVVKTLMVFSACREGTDGCSLLAAKTLMAVHHLPAPTCHDDMHAWLCACTLPRCHRRPSIRLISPRCYLCLSAYLRLLGSHRCPRNAGIRTDLLFSTPAISALIHTFADFFKGKGKGKGSRGLIWIHRPPFLTD